jgi:hypothetical protein
MQASKPAEVTARSSGLCLRLFLSLHGRLNHVACFECSRAGHRHGVKGLRLRRL